MLGRIHSDSLHKIFFTLTVKQYGAVSALPICGFSHLRLICGPFVTLTASPCYRRISECFLLARKMKKSFEYEPKQNASLQVNARQEYKMVTRHIVKALWRNEWVPYYTCSNFTSFYYNIYHVVL